ncbi:MAG: Uridine kinase [Chlamydiales bacterium]|nr:Uridine kinase [Chlamydiales bacterium]MCH9635924.1 Uridine kinase [Chlamydiales bacterium]MCH9704047.1 hypothetical protein [Chlamydiota bacterium]
MKTLESSSIIIGISGVSGSGKTEVTHALSQILNDASTIFWDDFETLSGYPSDYIEWYKKSGDYAEWKTPHLADTLGQLKKGIPLICPATRKQLQSTPFIIYDAPLGRKHLETGKYIDFLVFLNVPLDITLIRRLRRDYFNKEPFDLDAVKCELDFYEKEARPLFLDIENLKQGADLLVDGMQSTDMITDSIAKEIQKRYGNTPE